VIKSKGHELAILLADRCIVLLARDTERKFLRPPMDELHNRERQLNRVSKSLDRHPGVE
jgi:hypothetical protein